MINRLEEIKEEIRNLMEEVENIIVTEIGRYSQPYLHFKTYGKYGFNQLLGLGNPYDYGIDEIIQEINKKEE